jgi:prepilin-type N-terminal cleavage/methylation domain-containing protein
MSFGAKTRARLAGFSLIEMLIAVTVLALLGTVVIQVFLTADRMNRQALVLDRAVSLSADVVERLKAGIPEQDVDRGFLTQLFPESLIDATDTGWQVEMLLDDSLVSLPPQTIVRASHLMLLTISEDPQTDGLSSLVHVAIHEAGDPRAIPRAGAPSGPSESEETWKAEPLFDLDVAIAAGCDTGEVTP